MERRILVRALMGLAAAITTVGVAHMGVADNWGAFVGVSSQADCGPGSIGHAAVNGNDHSQVIAWCGSASVQNCNGGTVQAQGCDNSGTVCVMTATSSGASVTASNSVQNTQSRCRECIAGRSCTVPGKSGPCATGQTQCNGAAETCVQTVFPTSEVCDNVDNNCDGSIDNGIPARSCTAHVCSRNLAVTGTQTCSHGSFGTCVAPPAGPSGGNKWCTICGSNPTCGECIGNSCGPGNLCAPNSLCTNGRCVGPESCPADCWLPSEVGRECL
jgi:hypothetical protein